MKHPRLDPDSSHREHVYALVEVRAGQQLFHSRGLHNGVVQLQMPHSLTKER